MAQAQLDAVNFSMCKPELSSLLCLAEKKEIICWIDDRFSFEVKRTKQGTIVVLKEGKKTFKLTIEKLEALCDLKYGILLLDAFLRGNEMLDC